eukprot:m.22981 g.22981  ORF g.22981 m.22981 type:complete len:146 (-) comp13062_c0_seq2:183-620(-)
MLFSNQPKPAQKDRSRYLDGFPLSSRTHRVLSRSKAILDSTYHGIVLATLPWENSNTLHWCVVQKWHQTTYWSPRMHTLFRKFTKRYYCGPLLFLLCQRRLPKLLPLEIVWHVFSFIILQELRETSSAEKTKSIVIKSKRKGKKK